MTLYVPEQPMLLIVFDELGDGDVGGARQIVILDKEGPQLMALTEQSEKRRAFRPTTLH